MLDKITYQVYAPSLDFLESEIVTTWYSFLEFMTKHGLLDKPLENYYTLC